MNPDDDEKDWFAEAIDYATASPEASRAKAAADRLEIRIREAQKKAIREAQEKAIRDGRTPYPRPSTLPVDPAKVADAMKAFGIAATTAAAGPISSALGTALGGIVTSATPLIKSPAGVTRSADRWKEIYALDPSGTDYPTSANSRKPPTPEQGLVAILDAVRKSPDPFKSAGQWITTITTALATIINESDDNSE